MRLDEKDIKVEVYRLNSHLMLNVGAECGVRLTHIPTGESVTCSVHRSQIANKAEALQLLESRVALHYYQEASNEIRELSGE